MCWFAQLISLDSFKLERVLTRLERISFVLFKVEPSFLLIHQPIPCSLVVMTE